MNTPTQSSSEELKTGYIKVLLDYAPRDTDENFRAWCKKHDFDCFGLGVGREAWCSRLGTYLRGVSGVAYAEYEPFLFYEEDVVDLQAYTDEIRREVIEWGSWLKGKCDLHKKYTSACCGCQRANHAYVTNQQRIEWSLEALNRIAAKWGVK